MKWVCMDFKIYGGKQKNGKMENKWWERNKN